MLLRGETIKYSKQRAKALRKQEKDAEQEIAHFRNVFAQTGTENDVNNLLIAQEKLERLREPKIQGAITRSRVRWHGEGEKCSKYFLSLEKRNGIRKSVQSLDIDGQTVTEKRKYFPTLPAI